MTDGQSLMMTVQQLDDYSDSMEFTVPSPSTSDSFGQGKKRKMDNVISLLNIITKISQNLVERSNRDEFSVFGEYVANEMRHLSGPKYRRILLHTRQKINAILSEAEMQRIEIDEENE